MFKATIPGILNRSRTLLARRFGSEIQNLLAQMLFNDDVNVLTTFDMNRIVSYTFGETICGEIFDVLEYALRNPLEFTVLSLHKTLVLMHHLAIYASQKAANNIWILKPHVQPLLEYNTVLWAIQEPKSMLARLQRIKGGSVDRGRPVRESTKVLHDLLSDVHMFKLVRESSADPNSLVPVGHHEFVSDDIRKATLEEQIKNKHQVQIKSSLHDGGIGGFGSGTRTVVGAAHSMEEMLKMAKQNQNGYRDGQLSKDEMAHAEHLRQLEEELMMKKAMGFGEDGSGIENGGIGVGGGVTVAQNAGVVDLLDFGNDEPERDVILPSASVESLPYAVAKEDPFLFHAEPEEDHISLNNVDVHDHDHDQDHNPIHDHNQSLSGSNEDNIFGSSHSTAQSNHHSSTSVHIHDPFDTVVPALASRSTSAPGLVSAPSASVQSDAMDLLSLSMGGVAVDDGNVSGSGSFSGNGQASSQFMGGTNNAQSSSAYPMSAFDDFPTSSSSSFMDNSSNNNLMGGSVTATGMGLGMPPVPTMQPPPPPVQEPPLPPPPTDTPPTPPSQLMGGQSMPHSYSHPTGTHSTMGGSSGTMNDQNGMNSMGNMQTMNPMMMNNPMMMQNAMQNMNPEQQSQMMQQMMMMNQQMMAQLMQLQGQQGQGQDQGRGQGSNNGGSNHGGSNNNYPGELNPFTG
jgi:hypothetical protein